MIKNIFITINLFFATFCLGSCQTSPTKEQSKEEQKEGYQETSQNKPVDKAKDTTDLQTNKNEYESNTFDNWFRIDSYNRVVSFSKVAAEGNISVFIVGYDGCKPCKQLKKQLQSSNDFSNDMVAFYDVNLTSGHSYREFEKTEAYTLWRFFERLKVYPTIYIYGPTTNLIKKFDGQILLEEGFKGSLYDKTVQTINRLHEYIRKYYTEGLIIGNNSEKTLVKPYSDSNESIENGN